VFALHKAERVRHIFPHITFRVRDASAGGKGHFGSYYQEIAWPNETISDSEPFLVHTLVEEFATPGAWSVVWDVNWTSCLLDGYGYMGGQVRYNQSLPFGITLDIADGGQPMDLVAATADEKACHAGVEPGFAFNVSDRADNLSFIGRPPHVSTCVVVPKLEDPEPTLQLCSVKIDSAAAATISASVKAKLCEGPSPPTDCPPKSEASTYAVRWLAVAGTTSLVAALGSMGFYLA
jgi:hypothetical protein